MPALKKERFEALAGYTRRPELILAVKELDWCSDSAERVLGVLTEDLSDHDFAGIILARDARQRFRAVDLFHSDVSKQSAWKRIQDSVELWAEKPDKAYYQGDEKGHTLKLFSPLVASSRLNPSYSRVSTFNGFSPAKGLIEAMMPYFEDIDGNFVEQFQTSAFDARFWELYLYSLLTEQGFAFDRSHHAPDFCCESLLGSLFVEAVTVNPSRDKDGVNIEPDVPAEPEGFLQYYQEYMPIKWGSALTSKLNKKYWELPHLQGEPIVLAIQDFHVPKAMMRFASSIIAYLYGYNESATFDVNGKLIVTSTPRKSHTWGDKTIESGFFNLPACENISAVLTNPTATITKFNRMGYLSGFGSRNIEMTYRGECHDRNPNAAIPQKFEFNVSNADYTEEWVEGANVFHNPNAKIPIDESFLPGAAHHRMEKAGFRSLIPDFHPYGSETSIKIKD